MDMIIIGLVAGTVIGFTVSRFLRRQGKAIQNQNVIIDKLTQVCVLLKSIEDMMVEKRKEH